MAEKNSKKSNIDINEENTDKKKLITFSKMNKFFIIPFLKPVFYLVTHISFKKIIFSISRPQLVIPIYEELMHIFVGLFSFFSYFDKKTKRSKDNNLYRLNTLNSNQSFYMEKRKKDSKKLYIYIIVIGFLLSIYQTLNIINPADSYSNIC